MSFWRKVIGSLGDRRPSNAEVSRDASRWAFVDVEVGLKDKRIHDIGILRWDDAKFHSGRKKEAKEFLDGVDFICGHNVVHHDVKYLFGDEHIRWGLVDTLYMSPLLFPERPYHHLLKDDKLRSDQVNNPLNVCEKAYELLLDEMEAWKRLPRSFLASWIWQMQSAVRRKSFQGIFIRFSMGAFVKMWICVHLLKSNQ